MLNDTQRASMWKRISAFLCDFIVLSIVVMGIAFLLSTVLNYNEHSTKLEESYGAYAERYGIDFEVGNTGEAAYTAKEEALFKSLEAEYETAIAAGQEYGFKKFDINREKYNALSSEEKVRYDFQYSVAYKALTSDKEVLYTYNLVINLTLVITTVSILISYVVTEFIIPILLKNGQTLGKKVFGIGLMRVDGVKLNNMMLFVRTVLGKFTIETMVPVYIIIMLFFNTIGIVGTVVLGLILLLQTVLVAATKNRTPIHDALAGTVCVDIQSQRIFESEEELINLKTRIHAEAAQKAEYK